MVLNFWRHSNSETWKLAFCRMTHCQCLRAVNDTGSYLKETPLHKRYTRSTINCMPQLETKLLIMIKHAFLCVAFCQTFSDDLWTFSPGSITPWYITSLLYICLINDAIISTSVAEGGLMEFSCFICINLFLIGGDSVQF